MSTSESEQYDLLDRLAEEFAARFRRGERPALKEYTDNYPELADDIHELFPAMVRVEQAEGARQVGEQAGDYRATNPPLSEVGDYRILREIGRGGMGVVYEAEQISLGRRVALKVLPRQVSGDGTVQERFRREARAAARLHHTNIVPVYDVGQDGDVRFYAMQFIQGLGLDAVIDELRRLRDRSRSETTTGAALEGQSSPPRRGRFRRGIEDATREGAEVSAVTRSILTGRFDPGSRNLERLGASPSMQDATLATVAETEIAADGPIPQHPLAPALSSSASASSSTAILPGGTQLSSVESGRRTFYRSLAQIGRQVAAALAYAHARGIVHRDIKPSNLLLDSEGVVWITDFGLAKADDEGLTQTGDILGTLRYMAPERFRGEGDARADVYALGLTLYELITLRSGFDSADRLKLMEQIKAEEPQKPRSVDARIPRDLETIVLKAIEKDPKARYQTAEAMGEDLGRFLADEPIRARQVGAGERSWRWARRNPGIAVLGGVLTAVLVAATVLSMTAASGYERIARREKLANDRSQHDRKDAIEALKAAEIQREDARQQREVARQNLYNAQMHLAQGVWREHRGLPHMRELLANWLPQGESPDRRGWEWFYLNALPYQNLHTLSPGGSKAGPCTVAWHLASKRLAAGTADGVIRIWDVDREETTLTLIGPGRSSGAWWGIRWLAWSPDGGKLAGGFLDGTIHVWDSRSGRELGVFREHKTAILAVAYTSDGRRLASWEDNGTIKIRDVDTGRLTADIHQAGGVSAGALSPDDKLVATGRHDGTVTISDAHAGGTIARLRGHVDLIYDLAWSPDGARLASAGGDFTARIWEVASAKMVVGPLRHSHGITAVAWEPGGRRLATGSIDQSVKIWDATTGRDELTLRGHVESVTSLAWTPDGRLASGGSNGSARIWSSIRDQESSVLPGHTPRATSVAWSPDGRRLASGGDDGMIRIRDHAAGREVLTLKAHEGPVWTQYGLIRALAWSPDGRRLASGALDGTARVWEADSGREVFALPADHGPVWSLSWSPDGTHLAVGSKDGMIRVVEGLERTPKTRSYQAHNGHVRALAWSPRGDRLASGGADGLVKLWDPIAGVECATMTGHRYWVMSLAWSPDGTRLASASGDFAVIAWDAATGRKLSIMRGHNDFVEAVGWSPDGTRLASASIDNTVRLWDPVTGEEALVLRGDSGMFHDVSWHPDGTRLAAASSDGHVWVWDATLGFERDTTPRAWPFLDRRIASGTARGEDVRSWADLAESQILAGRTEPALALLGKCARANPTDTVLSLRLATLHAWLGNEADFNAGCRRLIEQAEGTNTPADAGRAATVYCLRPSTDADLMARALKLARRAVELGKADPLLPRFQTALGMAEYREGQYLPAEATLAAVLQSSGDPLIEKTSRLFRVMSLFQQGRRGEARERLGEIEARMAPGPADAGKTPRDGEQAAADERILRLVHREARSLLLPVSSNSSPAIK